MEGKQETSEYESYDSFKLSGLSVKSRAAVQETLHYLKHSKQYRTASMLVRLLNKYFNHDLDTPFLVGGAWYRPLGAAYHGHHLSSIKDFDFLMPLDGETLKWQKPNADLNSSQGLVMERLVRNGWKLTPSIFGGAKFRNTEKSLVVDVIPPRDALKRNSEWFSQWSHDPKDQFEAYMHDVPYVHQQGGMNLKNGELLMSPAALLSIEKKIVMVNKIESLYRTAIATGKSPRLLMSTMAESMGFGADLSSIPDDEEWERLERHIATNIDSIERYKQLYGKLFPDPNRPSPELEVS